jgi:hypothetical protein
MRVLLGPYVKFAPVTLGKQRIGIMSKTKAHATLPMALEYFPRFQGPGLKRLPTKKTRMKIGMVNALSHISRAITPCSQKLTQKPR